MFGLDVIAIKITNDKVTFIRIPSGKENVTCTGVKETYALSENVKITIDSDKFIQCPICGNYFMELTENGFCDNCLDELSQEEL